MKRKSLGKTQCPIARSLERVGDGWTILLLRDAFHGMTRFDEFQRSLGIAPNILTRRLEALVGAGLLERRRYSAHPLRHEYVLTKRGRDFCPVLWALANWGNRQFAPEGPSVQIVDSLTGVAVEPVLIDRSSGRALEGPAFRLAAGPAANERTRLRYARTTMGVLAQPGARTRRAESQRRQETHR